MRFLLLLLAACGAGVRWPEVEAGRVVTPVAAERARAGDPDALRALGRIGGDDAVALLRQAVASRRSNNDGRAAAVEGLWLAGATDAAPDIARVSGGSAAQRRAVARALGALGGDAQAAGVLEAALGDADASVRAAAARALGVWGRRKIAVPAGARAALRRLAGDGDAEVRFGAAYGLSLQPDGEEDLLERGASDPLPEVRTVAVRGLAARGKAPERALSDADVWVRSEASRGLSGAKSTPAQRERLAAWLETQARPPNGGGPLHPVLLALTGLQPYAAESAVAQAFERVHASAVDPAVHCLAAAGRVRAGVPLRVLLDCGPAWPAWARAQVVSAVLVDGKGDPAERLQIWRQYTDSEDPRLRAEAVAIGVKLGDPAIAASVLEHALADTSVVVVGAALDRLKDAGEDVKAALVARADKEIAAAADPELVISLLDALGEHKPEGAARAVEAALRAPNASVRAAARKAWKELTGKEPPAEARTALPPPADAPVSGPLWLRVETARGVFRVELLPGVAPWNVAHVAALAGRGFYDGTICHRVVPGFVLQCGDPTGTGWGGSGTTVPGEPSGERFVRGTVGIADAGRDTGDSQWFVMHQPAPHLEGRYTIIGRVAEKDMAVVDKMLVGDEIRRVVVERPMSASGGEAMSLSDFERAKRQPSEVEPLAAARAKEVQ